MLNTKTNSTTKTLVEKGQKLSFSIETLYQSTTGKTGWEVDIGLSKTPNNFVALLFEKAENNITSYCIMWLHPLLQVTTRSGINYDALGFDKAEPWKVTMDTRYLTQKTIRVSSQHYTSSTVSSITTIYGVYGLNLVVN